MKRQFVLSLICVMTLVTGCAFFRYEVIPQETSGPHGGALTFIDKRIPEYIEFVTSPGDEEWTFQVFAYNKHMNQKELSRHGYLEMTFPDGTKRGIRLWNTKKFAWSKGKGHLERKVSFGNAEEFSVLLTLSRHNAHGPKDRMVFNYPY